MALAALRSAWRLPLLHWLPLLSAAPLQLDLPSPGRLLAPSVPVMQVCTGLLRGTSAYVAGGCKHRQVVGCLNNGRLRPYPWTLVCTSACGYVQGYLSTMRDLLCLCSSTCVQLLPQLRQLPALPVEQRPRLVCMHVLQWNTLHVMTLSQVLRILKLKNAHWSAHVVSILLSSRQQSAC